MTSFEIDSRYQELMDEGNRLMRSVQNGILLDNEAAIAIADLRGRMMCLERIKSDRKSDRALFEYQTFSMDN